MTVHESQQRSLFAADASHTTRIPTPKPDDVRRRLNGIIRKLRESDELPFTVADFRSWRVVFPQMSRWLPDEEANALKEEFFREHDRWRDKLGPEADPPPPGVWKQPQP